MLTLQDFTEHRQITLEAPYWVRECGRLILLDEEVTDPGKEVGADQAVHDFHGVDGLAEFPSQDLESELAFCAFVS